MNVVVEPESESERELLVDAEEKLRLEVEREDGGETAILVGTEVAWIEKGLRDLGG